MEEIAKETIIMIEEIKNISKEKLLEKHDAVCKQIKDNKNILEPYFGKTVEVDSKIAQLFELTTKLLTARYCIEKELMIRYGLFIMDDDF